MSFDGTEVTTVAELNGLKEGHKAGDAVEVKIFRTEDESELTVTVVLAEDTPTVERTASGETVPDWI